MRNDNSTIKMSAPFVSARDNTRKVMLDVVIALLPCLLMSYMAFGFTPVLAVLVSVVSAMAAEFLFSWIFLGKKDSIFDCSFIVTGMLLAFTLAPFTPLYVVAFGAAMAVIFGKIFWGGLGRNTLNPALVGREFATIFFPVAMSSSAIWYSKEYANYSAIDPFSFLGEGSFINYLNNLFFKPGGAIGEYSIFFLILGGLYLLLRRRISWHIPLILLGTFTVLTWVFADFDMKYSVGGLLLGTIFMATDMPSSAATKGGKVYYAAMIAIVAVGCILFDVRYEYMSYSILLVNAFCKPINNVFIPRVWGKKRSNLGKMILNVALLTLAILAATAFIIFLHKYDAIKYLLFAFIAFIIIRFVREQKMLKAQ